MDTLGEGLGSLAFWGFLAAVVVTSIWAASRRRQIQHETLRRVIESGQELTPEVMERLLPPNNSIDQRPDVGLKVASAITAFVALGLAAMSFFIAHVKQDALFPILGSALMVGCISLGLFVASKVAKQLDNEDRPSGTTKE